ncbi:MAG: helix-hairpin-helix domain-containing protein [Candidatus Marsarchaeota archaeon]|nr:helix-hairpin-helix domain-containing protein [Candidatus Marsarchaeota archaeon]
MDIIYDDREKTKAIEILKQKFKMERQRLEVADFIISTDIGIERKRAGDFEQSIIDGRLFSQVERLKEEFEKPLIVIIGNDFERITSKALSGAFISLIVDHNIPIVFLNNEEEFAEFISRIVEREGKPARERKTNFSRKNKDLKLQQLNVIEALPGVGPMLARNLLQKFRTIKNLFNADEKQLREVEGVGKIKAKKIKDLFLKED